MILNNENYRRRKCMSSILFCGIICEEEEEIVWRWKCEKKICE